MPRYAKDTLNELLKDPEFRKEWESMEPEFQIIKAMIDARNEKGITQKELSSITGITQGDTALCTEIDLALAADAYSEETQVDFETVWGQGHTMAERTGSSAANFIAWVQECMQ